MDFLMLLFLPLCTVQSSKQDNPKEGENVANGKGNAKAQTPKSNIMSDTQKCPGDLEWAQWHLTVGST